MPHFRTWRSILFLLLPLTLCSLVLSQPAHARQGVLIPRDGDLEAFLLRQHNLGHIARFDPGRLPLTRFEAESLLDELAAMRDDLPSSTQQDLDRFTRAFPWDERPTLPLVGRAFFKDGSNYLSYRGEGLTMQANPLAGLAIGTFKRSTDSEESDLYWRNRRGLMLSGTLGRYVYFSTSIEEVQERLVDPGLLRQNTLPGYRVVRNAPSIRIDEDGNAIQEASSNTLDYGPASGVVGIRTERVDLRMGRDRYHFGPGVTSVILSDQAAVYDHVQATVRAGRVTWSSVVASLVDRDMVSVYGTPARTYGVWHRLAVRISDDVMLEGYQGMMAGADTSMVGSSAFDIGLLNPAIMLRQVEKDWGRFGNKMLGAGGSWRVMSGWRIYGQFFLDEFVSDQLFAGNGYWANKWATLVGTHVSVSGPFPADLWVEYSSARPFTYSHSQTNTNYVHFGDNLGHPRGGNFREVLARLDIRLGARMDARIQGSYALQGVGADNENTGWNPSVDYTSRTSDSGYHTLDGQQLKRLDAHARISIRLLPQTWLDLFAQGYRTRLEDAGSQYVHQGGINLRMAVGAPVHRIQ